MYIFEVIQIFDISTTFPEYFKKSKKSFKVSKLAYTHRVDMIHYCELYFINGRY